MLLGITTPSTSASMLAPPIQQSITLFFSPLLHSKTSASTGTTTTVTDRKSNYLSLRAAEVASSRKPMRKPRRLPDAASTKSKTPNTRGTRVVVADDSVPLTKRRKLADELQKRVDLLPKSSANTLSESRISDEVDPTKHQDKSTVRPPSRGTTTENGATKTTQKKDNNKLKVETGGGVDQQNNVNALVPTEGHTKEEGKRCLRSHDGGSRSKSELAQYFPNFDEIINPDSKEKELLTPRTRLFVTDEPTKSSENASFILPSPIKARPSTSPSSPGQQKRPPIIADMKFEKTELPTLAEVPKADPMADSHYEVAHRRAERQEKQLRNIERERAQHEKVQLERLQEGLLGPDWLKIMGISGVTEGDRKKWDDARDYFLKEVQYLLDKFSQWKEEERKRKLLEVQKRREAEEEKRADEEDSEEEDGSESEVSTPDAAAHQLQQESLSASKTSKGRKGHPHKADKRDQANTAASGKRRLKTEKQELLPAEPVGPFTSFFAKPHQRAAAMDRSRRTTGRIKWAFGHPLPDIVEAPFSLPKSMISVEARKASARLRRGIRRDRD